MNIEKSHNNRIAFAALSPMVKKSCNGIFYGLISLGLLASNLGAAVSATTSFINNISSNSGSITTGTAGNSVSVINNSSLSLDSVGASAELGYRFAGHNSGRAGNANATPFNTTLTQSVDVSVTWTVNATAGETYNFSVNPELNASMVLAIVGGGSTGDRTEIGDINASLLLNSNLVSNTTNLNFSGDNNNVVPPSNILPNGSGRNVVGYGQSGSFVFEGLTGTNTFTLQYTGDLIANCDKVDENTGTANAVLWGMDGTSPDSDTLFNPDWDEYSRSDVTVAAADDGLFVKGTVTVIPEPSGLILAMAGLAVVGCRRRR